MRRVERLWFRAMEEGVDDRLLKFLSKLRIITKETWTSYMSASHSALIQHRNEKAMRRSRAESRSFSVPLRGPKQIKPTKARHR